MGGEGEGHLIQSKHRNKVPLKVLKYKVVVLNKVTFVCVCFLKTFY